MYRQSEKKNLLNSNTSSRCPHSMANFGPLTAGIGRQVSDTPATFNRYRFHVLASLLQRHRSAQANQTSHDVWPSPELVHYNIHFWGLLPLDGIFPGAKFTLRAVQVLRFILAASLHGTSAAVVCQTAAWYKEWV